MNKNEQFQGIIPIEQINNLILVIRGQKVIIDSDLANLYNVNTKALNQAIKRNQNRFPQDFAFRITKDEKSELVTNCDRFKNLKHSTSLPHAFTEYGALMVATILNSKIAIDMSLVVIRTFIQLRKMYAREENLLLYLKELERNYDADFKLIFDILNKLIDSPSNQNKLPIGFNTTQ